MVFLERIVVGKIGRPAARFWKPTMYLLRQTHATPRSSGVHGIRQGFAQEKNHMLGTYGLGVAASVPPIPRRGPSGLAILRRLARAAATWMFPIRAQRGMTSLDPAQGAGAAAPTRGAFQVPEPSEV